MSQARSRNNASTRTRLVRGGILGACLLYIGILLLVPLGGIIWGTFKAGSSVVGNTFGQADVRHAFLLTGVITLITIVVTTMLGVIVAWVLARQRFVGRSLLNAFVDLPFAMSAVTVGLAAVLLFGRVGWFESFFDSRGIHIIYALPSMVLVTIFISIPFTVREVAPVLEEIGTSEEDAARTLGASTWQSFFRVTLPNIRWALLYGVALSTARAMGEIGAVIIVSGSIQGQTETATLFVVRALDERQTSQAYLVALTLAAISVLLLVGIETARSRLERRKTR
ncbi:MAG: sulfate/thiosulfate transport system permease protein [Actinomycetota bacterium]|jgi:sulfate transport system permease protein|nr:sulfate/thiosulfate transport system permease protein [Actinomycetota bacterium]